MIDPNTQIPANDVAADTSLAPYQTFAEVQQVHRDLRRHISGDPVNPGRTAVSDIRSFITRLRVSGAVIEDKNERRAAQAILDYWTTRVATWSDAFGSDALPSLLAPFDAKNDSQARGHSAMPDEELPERSRELIRLAASARLWKGANRNPGFLLYGSAIHHAAKFRKLDNDVDDLVAASQQREQSKRKLWRIGGIIAVLSIILTVSIIYYASCCIIPDFSIQDAAKLADPLLGRRDKERALWRLSLYQKLESAEMGELNFSNAILVNVHFPGLHLQSPKFLSARLQQVDFPHARLPSSSFAANSHMVNGNFNRANLKYSDFRQSTIISTSFTGARLYQAVFDGARFCNVDFSGADLRSASFRRVRFENGFTRKFKDTAWWLAVGWDTSQIEELQQVEQTQEALVKSHAFALDKENAEGALTATHDTFDRARALNGLAWTFATWGINLKKADNKTDWPEGDCLLANDVPSTGLEAAREAVCIVKKLNETHGGQIYRPAVANYQDTLGYIFLQVNEISDAIENLKAATQEAATEALPNVDEIRFHYAVAQYALGEQDNSEKEREDAQNSVKVLMTPDGYVPSHELHNLRNYLSKGPLSSTVRSLIKYHSSTPQVPTNCGEQPWFPLF